MDAKHLSIKYAANLKKGRTVWTLKNYVNSATWPTYEILRESFRLLHKGSVEVHLNAGPELWISMPSRLDKKIRIAFLAIVASHM